MDVSAPSVWRVHQAVPEGFSGLIQQPGASLMVRLLLRESMNTTSTRLRQLADRMGLDGFAEELREIALEMEAPSEPFGYFRAEPMGWTDCAATDEGAIALYERPQVKRG